MRLIVITIILSGLLYSCSTAPKYRNLKTFPVDHPGCKGIVIVEQGFTYPLAFIDRDDNLKIIRSYLSGFGELRNLICSPDRSKVIIESYGEGHQMINVYTIGHLLEDYDQEDDDREDIYIDPYPYHFGRMRWVDDHTITFESCSNFAIFDKENRRGKYDTMNESDEVYREWHWDLKTDTFTLQSK